MDRREFLKVLGLGGVALTLPKPLSILAGIERPPLHVGRLLFPPLADDVTAFEMESLSISPSPSIQVARFRDFMDKWLLRVLRHEPAKSLDLLQVPAPYLLHSRETRERAPYTLGRAMRFLPGERLDCWLKPSEAPRYPLPEVSMILQGRLWRNGADKPMPYYVWGKFKTVRMDRDEAARLGICPAGEPVDDFAMDRREESVDWDQEGFDDAEEAE